MDTYKIKGEDHYQCREVKAERDALRAERDALKVELEVCCEQGAANASHLAKVIVERDELRAARISYASLFSPNADGEPNVGSIHENIRKLIAERDALQQLINAVPDETIWLAKCTIAWTEQANNWALTLKWPEGKSQ